MTRRPPPSAVAIAGLLAAGCGPAVPIDETGSGTGGAGESTSSSTTVTDPSDDSASVSTAQGGDSSSGGPDVDPPLLVCEPDAIQCDGSEYGTWRLSSADAQVAAYLYLWPSDDSESLQFVSRWFVDNQEEDYCTRNGTYLASGSLESMFEFQTDGLGGTITDRCGGEPGAHSIRLDLSRQPECNGEVLELAATDSNGDSLYAIEGSAVHCGCLTDYDPYSGNGEQIPTEDCLAP